MYQELTAEQMAERAKLMEKYNEGSYMRSLLVKKSKKGGFFLTVPMKHFHKVSGKVIVDRGGHRQ